MGNDRPNQASPEQNVAQQSATGHGRGEREDRMHSSVGFRAIASFCTRMQKKLSLR